MNNLQHQQEVIEKIKQLESQIEQLKVQSDLTLSLDGLKIHTCLHTRDMISEYSIYAYSNKTDFHRTHDAQLSINDGGWDLVSEKGFTEEQIELLKGQIDAFMISPVENPHYECSKWNFSIDEVSKLSGFEIYELEEFFKENRFVFDALLRATSDARMVNHV